MTVAQLEQTLIADNAAHRPDAETARRISDVELSERLTEGSLSRLRQPFAGDSRTATALLLLADRSAFLEPPPSELPANPAPNAGGQQHLLETAQRFALETLPRLPNLLATRTTFSFDDSPQEVTKGAYPQRLGLHLIGSSKAEVSVSNERVGQVTDTATQSGLASGGLTTWGEFGSALLIILSDSSQGKTTWSHWEETPAGMMAVFHYEVPKSASHYEIDTSVEEIQHNGESSRWAGRRTSDAGAVASWNRKSIHIEPPYEGSMWIDPATGTITRVTLVADLKGNPKFERGAILVEYGPVRIGDKVLTAPVRSLALSEAPSTVNSTFAGVATEWLNENLFTNYHLFSSTSRIVTEEAGAAPLAPAAPTATTATTPTATAETTAAREGAQGSAVAATAGEAAQAETRASSEEQAASALAHAEVSASVPTAASPRSIPPGPAAANAETAEHAGGAVQAATAADRTAAEVNAASAPQPQHAPPLPAGSEKGVTIRVNVDALLVPVVVRDKQDRAVGDLAAKDFTVLDQGKERPITGFSVVRTTAFREGAEQTGGETQDAGEKPTARTAGQNRFLIFLFDDRHLDTSDLVRTQQAALHVLDRPLGANEYAAVVSLMGVNSGITQDRAVLEAAVKKVSVHRSFQHDTHDCPDIDYYSANKILNEHDEAEFQIAVAEVDGCIGTHEVSQEAQPEWARSMLLRSGPAAGAFRGEACSERGRGMRASRCFKCRRWCARCRSCRHSETLILCRRVF